MVGISMAGYYAAYDSRIKALVCWCGCYALLEDLYEFFEPLQATLTGREREICDIIGPDLKQRGLIFVGIDVIGGYLTEINVTSPTGLQEINRFDNVCLEAQIWDAIEARL